MEFDVEASSVTTLKRAATKTKFSPQLVDRQLDKLASDDAFRALFKSSPETALMSIGADHDVKCERCMRPSELISKEQAQRAREVLRDKLLGDEAHLVFTLEATHY